MKGMRVQSIIRELRGEKIDIIEWHDDAVGFAEKALQPAKVSRVSIVDQAEKHLEVIVDDSQLSLAIGKKGQNVRLAAKLLGWKIDIKSEEEKRQEVEQQMQALVGSTTPLESVPGLGEALIEKLVSAGVTTVEQLADMTPEQLEEIPGIGPKTVEKISIAVNNYFSGLEAGETAVGQEAELASVEASVADEPAQEAQEAADTGQALESAAIAGVENAPAADVAEVHTHGDQENLAPEETVEPELPPADESAGPEVPPGDESSGKEQ
jgi:N utilization substance protein A